MPTPSSSRRLSPLPLLLIGLAALAVLVLIPWVVHAQDQTPANEDATGRPVVLAAAQGAGILFADTEPIADANGLPITASANDYAIFTWSYQWVRVDGNSETNVGADSATYHPVEADVGKLIKVEVSFTDGEGYEESVTSLPYGPLVRLPSRPATTLVSNTGQSSSSTADITEQYAVGFRLGDHGQGYEISSVSIELAAVPSSLTVSLWSGGVEGGLGLYDAGHSAIQLFDFANPSSFAVGLNEFTAPAGAFAYQNVNYFVVLSGFGASLSIKETTSNSEDASGETGAVISNDAAVRGLSDTGRWLIGTSRTGVLRLAVEGSRRDSGILVANYTQPNFDDKGTDDTSDDVDSPQEIISVGDEAGFGIELGAADRYLIRGVSLNSDDTTTRRGGFTNPFDLRSDSLTGAKQFSLANTRNAPGLSVWTAPQGTTVTGSQEYVFDWLFSSSGDTWRRDAVLSRIGGAAFDAVDSPAAGGVSFTGPKGGDVALDYPYMAVLGEPLDAMVQNLGQSNNGYVPLGGASAKVLSQGFTTGSNQTGYGLLGIGVNIEGSSDQFPAGASFVSVAVHTDSNGKPGPKLFDLVSPTEYGAGHSFFEAPPETNLAAETSYVLVWRYNDGALHRLQRTSSNSEDSGALTGFSIADAFYRGSNLSSLGIYSAGHALEIAVYGKKNEERPFVPGGHPVTLNWLHIPEGAEVGDQFRVVFVTIRGRLPTSGDIEDYNTWVQEEAAREYNHPKIRAVASQFKAVVCTEAVDARTNTGMKDEIGVPVHWLDGGWQDQPTLIANSYAEFYGGDWVNSDWGAYTTGNRAYFYDYGMVATGCDASGVAHPQFPMGNTSAMDMVAVGTPKGRSLKTREEDANPNFAPLGAIDVDSGFAYQKYYVVFKDLFDGKKQERLVRLYAISPIFTVVR